MEHPRLDWIDALIKRNFISHNVNIRQLLGKQNRRIYREVSKLESSGGGMFYFFSLWI